MSTDSPNETCKVQDSALRERVAKVMCSTYVTRFCRDIGGDLGCKCGRGAKPCAENCIADSDQLRLSGYTALAEEIIALVQSAQVNDAGQGHGGSEQPRHQYDVTDDEDRQAADEAWADYQINGGVPLHELKAELLSSPDIEGLCERLEQSAKGDFSWNAQRLTEAASTIRSLADFKRVSIRVGQEWRDRAEAAEARAQAAEERIEKALTALRDYFDECEFMQTDEAAPARLMFERAIKSLKPTGD